MGQAQPTAPDGATGTSVPVVSVDATHGPDESRTTTHQSEPKETLDDHA